MKRIALDIGGVCLNIHPERALAACDYRTVSEVPGQFFQLIRQMETGHWCEAEWIERLNRLVGVTRTAAEWRAIWNAIIGDPVPGMCEWITEATARGIELVFFSDTSAWHLAEVRRKLPVAHLIPEGIYSFEAGACKPDPAMFRRFEQRFGKPDCYIDDRLECLNGGLAFDWPLHHFHGVAGVRQLLEPRSGQ